MAAVQAVFGSDDIYICPVCGKEFVRADLNAGELTVEHVPPKSVGGKPVLLTCRRCNNTAGYSVDAAVSARERVTRFVDVIGQKVEGPAGRATLKSGESAVEVDVSHQGGVTALSIVPRSNDPRAVAQLSKHFEALAAADGHKDGVQMQLDVKQTFHERRARVGDLRIAFLACTALFGYRFALSSVLFEVRKQILNPDENVMSRWWIRGKKTDPSIGVSDSSGLVIVRCLGRSSVLPWPSREDDAYRRTVARLEQGEAIEADARAFQWPTFFEARLDVPREGGD